ncbi:DNA cytosine methyltransferase [Clostridium hydrogeniformans]|uniref:DNA cytosine methyltransferase n=1 Tax=Clostridium hydrogeniformans TaxID=349933 RepID=UPI000484A337|nr:DNA (cytosine-5-)-methyltransferase [Clostridium hydrogeniformans]
MALTFIDIFSGIGGFRLGMEMAGHKCLGHCENNKFANRSYEVMHNPKKEEWNAEDITEVLPEEIPRSDVWCMGFPCQDISVAGKRKGLKGTRSGLFYRVIKLIKSQKEENKPSILLIENVKNLLSINSGWDFASILFSLDEAGYDAEWQVLNSKDYGVAQSRERVFIIGHLRGRRTRKVFPIRRENSPTTLKQVIPGSDAQRVYDAIGLSRTLKANGGGQGAKTGLYVVGNTSKSGHNRARVYDEKGLAPTVMARDYKGPIQVMVHPVLTPDRVNKRQNGRRFRGNDEPMYTLTSQDKHGVLIKEATKKGYAEAKNGDSISLAYLGSATRRGRVGKNIAKTLTCTCNQATITRKRIRKLMPIECFRLQGFPDEYFYRAKEVNSDSQLYKQAGNSVTVTVIYAIAKRLSQDN